MAKRLSPFLLAPLMCVMTVPTVARDLPQISATEAGLSQQGIARLDAAIEAAVSDGRIPGAVALIGRKGSVAHFKAYGLSDRDKRTPMRRDDIFRIYSMTKPVVATALLMEFEKGKFRLDDPLEKYIPSFKGLKVYDGVDANGQMILVDPKRKPTIHDALRHTVGVGSGGGPAPVMKMYADKKILVSHLSSVKEQMELLSTVPLLFHPGDKWLYSYSVDIQAYLVEVFSGMPFDQYLEKEIFTPLGMVDTGFGVPDSKRARVATLHDVPEGPPPFPPVDMRPSTYERFAKHPFGTLGLWSTTMDYARFSMMLANGGELDGVRILGRKTVEWMGQNHLPANIDHIGDGGIVGTGWGLGVAVSVNPALEGTLASPGTFGWTGAATTKFFVDPKEELIAVLMTQKYPYDEDILDIFQNLVYQSLAK